MLIPPEISGAAVVLLGHFNPSIFTPHWFGRYGVVSNREADAANIVFVLPEMVSFKIGSMSISVDRNRFSIETFEAPWVSILDFVTKTFGEVLPHTPIDKLGINRQIEFNVHSEEIRNRMGRSLAPLGPWGEWGRMIGKSPQQLRGGFANLVMQETWSDPPFRGYYQAHVKPSQTLGNRSIFMLVNHHCEKLETKPDDGAQVIVNYLTKSFDGSLIHSEWIMDQIMKLADSSS